MQRPPSIEQLQSVYLREEQEEFAVLARTLRELAA